MDTLEGLVRNMETQMDRADSKLDILSLRLDQFETRVLLTEGNPSEQEKHLDPKEGKTEEMQGGSEDAAAQKSNDDDDGLDPKLLTELLVEVTRVKEEYDQLLSDVHQVQELQQEVTRSLRKQMKQVQSHFDKLRERVVGSTGNSSLPSNK